MSSPPSTGPDSSFQLLEDREVILKHRFTEIDGLQAEVDDDIRALAVAKASFARMQADFARVRKVKKSHQISFLYHIADRPSIDRSKVSEENNFHLSELERSCSSLMIHVDEAKGQVEDTDQTLQLLRRDDDNLRQSATDHATDRARAKTRIRDLRESTSLTQQKITAVKADIRAQRALLTDLESVLFELESRQAACEGEVGNQALRRIRDLDAQIAGVDNEIADLGAELRNLTDDTKHHETRVAEDPNQGADWRIEQRKLKGELTANRKRLESATKEYDGTVKTNNADDRRFRELQPLAKKWVSQYQEQEIAKSTDNLLTDLERVTASRPAEGGKQTADRDVRRLANGERQAELSQLEQRFVRDVRRFRREEAKIKRDITQRRKDESDKEDRLLTQLKTLKIKIAQSTQAGQRR